MWCKVSHFVKIHMLRLRASDLGIGAYITALKVFMKSFKGVCLWDSLFVSGLNQCRTWNCFACYGIFSEVGTAILAGSVLQNLYYLSPSGAIIVTSQWGHLVACGAGIALDREYQCRSLYGLENWAFITNACTNAKDFTCSKLNWNDVPRFMLPAVFY